MIAPLTLPDLPLSQPDLDRAETSSRALSKLVHSDHPLRLVASEGDREPVEIPAAAARLLVELLSQMAQGNAVTLIPVHAELTTQRAADLLGVSRPFVVKEIEDGRLPAKLVGTHRRILFQDLMAYKNRMDADRRKALDNLAALDQELGLI